MKFLFSIIFAWWFAFNAYHARGVVGPFESKIQCETIRSSFLKKNLFWDTIYECESDNPEREKK